MTERCAVILAAGKGTRMKSELAKVLHPFREQPLIVYPLRAALDAGADRVVVVTGHQGVAVRDAVSSLFGDANGKIQFVEQAQQNGTGHAVLCALPKIPQGDIPVWILSGDTPMIRAQTLRRVAEAAETSAAKLAVGTMHATGHTGYGRLLRDHAGKPLCIREERDCSPEEFDVPECNAGLYCVSAMHLHTHLATLGRNNAQGEIYLTDLIETLARQAEVATVSLEAVEAAGINTPEQLIALEAEACTTGC